jgi:hypothetical protein
MTAANVAICTKDTLSRFAVHVEDSVDEIAACHIRSMRDAIGNATADATNLTPGH